MHLRAAECSRQRIEGFECWLRINPSILLCLPQTTQTPSPSILQQYELQKKEHLPRSCKNMNYKRKQSSPKHTCYGSHPVRAIADPLPHQGQRRFCNRPLGISTLPETASLRKEHGLSSGKDAPERTVSSLPGRASKLHPAAPMTLHSLQAGEQIFLSVSLSVWENEP